MGLQSRGPVDSHWKYYMAGMLCSLSTQHAMLLLTYLSCAVAENIKLALRGCKEALLPGRTMMAWE